jgi:hypothetical protein
VIRILAEKAIWDPANRGQNLGGLDFFGLQMALAEWLDAISQGPKISFIFSKPPSFFPLFAGSQLAFLLPVF